MASMRVMHLLVVLLTGLGACSAVPEAQTVRALRFRQFVYLSETDQRFGGGQWQDCLYLPDARLLCQVAWCFELLGPDGRPARSGQPGSLREFSRLHVRPARIEEELAARPQGSPEGQRPPEEIRIEASLAREIIALAEITEQHWAMSERLASRCISAGAIGDRDSAIRRDF